MCGISGLVNLNGVKENDCEVIKVVWTFTAGIHRDAFLENALVEPLLPFIKVGE